MVVLVAYATRHNGVEETAQRIAKRLHESGFGARAAPVLDVKSLTSYQAVILGGTAHRFHWLGDAERFARRHRKELAEKPVWLFHGTPAAGDSPTPPEPQPKEFHDLMRVLEPRGQQVFGSDKAAIDAWADEVAKELRGEARGSP